MLDVMLDLETMGNGPDAAIIAIGAAAFDAKLNTLGETFYLTVDLESSVAAGGIIDPSTVLWWMAQSDEARAEFRRTGCTIETVLALFKHWLHTQGHEEEIRVWGNGAAFDNVILAGAYKRKGLEAPWAFRNDRCFRTLRKLRPEIKVEKIGTCHNALDDAVWQAELAIRILSDIGG